MSAVLPRDGYVVPFAPVASGDIDLFAVSPEADVDVGTIVLDVANKTWRDARVDEAITGGRLERTMDGASTLSLNLHDPGRELLRSGIFSQQIDLKLDTVWWRLVKVSKQGDDLSLTFEDRAVAIMRKYDEPRKAARSKMTRAEFALSLVREAEQRSKVRIPFVCPDLHKRQPVAIETEKQKRKPAEREAKKQQGLTPGANVTVKGKGASTAQRDNAERAMDVANSLNASERATLALLQACTQESGILNLNYGDRDSKGILQVRDSTAKGMKINNRDVEACCHAFLSRGFTGRGGAISLAANNPSMGTGAIAQAVQGSAYPTAYNQWEAEARKWLAAYGGAPGDALGGTTDAEVSVPYQFMRGGTDGEKENTWDCLQRLAEEVEWRCFVTKGSVHFIADPTLMKAKAKATVGEFSDAVLSLDFDIDNGKVESEVSLVARTDRWAFPPGSVIELTGTGPADGRWLIDSIERGLFDASADISLRRATQPLPEPAEETKTVSTGAGGSGEALPGDVPSAVQAVYNSLHSIHGKRYPYVFGGGHGKCGQPSGGRDPGIGFDCSGSTCAALSAGRMGYTPGGRVDVSGTMARSWGQPGKGQHFTVYANSEHVFIVWHDRKKGDKHFGTGDWGKGWGGAGWNPRMHHLSGFAARHWPGA